MELLLWLPALAAEAPLALTLLGGVVVLGLVLLVFALVVVIRVRRDPINRLEGARRRPEPEPQAAGTLRRSDGAFLDRFADLLEPQSAQELDAARLRMIQAGYPARSALRRFHFAQAALGLGLLVPGVIYAGLSAHGGDLRQTVLTAMVPGLIGYYLPRMWIDRRIKARRQQIIDGFADSLDMMLVCVEAGQTLEMAFIRVGREMRGSFPALVEEFELVSHEMKAGKDKAQVLRDFGTRSGVQDVSAFVTVLIQSAAFGTSISDALRIYSAEMRDKRVMRAEEKANVLPTKLTLGTMMFTVPPLMLILIGPSIYGIVQTLGFQ